MKLTASHVFSQTCKAAIAAASDVDHGCDIENTENIEDIEIVEIIDHACLQRGWITWITCMQGCEGGSQTPRYSEERCRLSPLTPQCNA